ncbi:hybrid sensor histidine kinase/response regulator [Flavobacterium sp. RSP49]|uniref:ATP-binding response regulator n=1 Tax=Flavobacterium sp. RSP49 TaxID=2497487 RepID=UPI000F824402|nr:HAMP domain-containing sensor histidine kinase [Flavobacterium sp. RSP49]RTZ02859.1 hybrid sensor histidine kinase/response regulator [Flavobacterium sp. RSP49]
MKKNNILLVDDDPNIRETIAELLRYENYEVKVASNGQNALDLLEYWTPDLIICDIMMPVMDGHVFHKIISENQSLSPIPFIFLTAKKENNLRRKCLLEGVDDFLSKPFKIKELIKIIAVKIERFEKIKNANNNLYIGEKNHFAHEINTPLSGILGSIELLMDAKEDYKKNEIATFYDSIKVSGERLNRTMQNLILYQNLKNNTIEFDHQSKTEIATTFVNTTSKIFEIYDKKNNTINFKIDEATIKISQRYLNFILFELIDNALKFSKKNPTIIVSGQKYNEEYYELVIKDYGIGFSPSELNKIGAAQQFKREEREQQGLGMGLFLSKTIIKKINGVFSIVSTENEGTTIKIFLPLDSNC